MATRKGRKGYRKFKPRRTTRRQSATGSIALPLDVRSKEKIGELMKMIRKGPLTIMLVYADWCGHCHHFMPHFDAAAQNSNHSMNAVKVNETMVSDVNEALKRNAAKPINVEGYPSVLLVGQNGNEVTQIEPVKDTAVMTKVMNQSLQLANEAGLVNNGNASVEESEMKASIRPNNTRTPPKVASLQASTTPDFIVDDMGESDGVSLARSVKSPRNNNIMEENEPSLAVPPYMNTDREMENMNGSVKKGGSLYTALSQSAYTLAAPAALLATAALMMKRNTRKSHKGKHHKGKRSSHKGKRSSRV
jgi:thiol-disulfide isomerase/thioredoxin